MDISPRLEGDEWQIWADKLLKLHYGPGEYQSVPDTDRGDAGIEGFTISTGHAYQAYGPEGEPLSVPVRFERHRNKITTDINKFINNKQLFEKIFGNTKISRWILLVPVSSSKEILKHASKKTEEVLTANLPYVTKDFRVFIEDESFFSIERDKLLNANVGAIHLAEPDICEEDMMGWIDKNDTLVATIDDKLSRLPNLTTVNDRTNLRNQIIKAYLNGQNTLNELRDYPIAYEKFCKLKSHKERYLSLETIAITDTSNILKSTFNDLQETAMKIPGASDELVETLAWEAISDWLIRCPLDFPRK